MASNPTSSSSWDAVPPWNVPRDSAHLSDLDQHFQPLWHEDRRSFTLQLFSINGSYLAVDLVSSPLLKLTYFN